MSEGGSGAKIVAVLELDDHASHALERVKEGFHEVKEKAAETAHEILGVAKQIAITAAGFNFSAGIDSIKEFAEEVFHAANEQNEQLRGLQNLLVLTDKFGESTEQLKKDASEINEEMETWAMTAGVAKDRILDAFSAIAERSDKSTDEISDLVHNMMDAGRAVRGGMEAISQGYTAMEMGVIRANNAVVKLITSQHLLGGNAKEVAKQLMKMSPEERLKIADEAIGQTAKKMGSDSELPFDRAIVALKEIREHLFEAVGGPMVDALTRQLNRLHKYFLDNGAAIEQWAHDVGVKAGEWLTEAAEKIKEGFEYLKNHADEIKEAIMTAWGYVRDVVTLMIENKAIIAGFMLTKAGVGMGGDAMKFGSMISGAGGFMGALDGLAAFTAALASTTLAVDQFMKFNKESGANSYGPTGLLQNDYFAAGMMNGGPLNPIATMLGVAERGEGRQDLAATDKAMKEASANMAIAADTSYETFLKWELNYQRISAALGDSTESIHAHLQALVDERNANLDAAQSLYDMVQGQGPVNLGGWVDFYNKAAQAHNQGAMQMAANVIAGSGDLQQAFLDSGLDIVGGMDDLAAMVKNKAADFATELSTKKDDYGPTMKQLTYQPPPVTNFNGGQTFNIKQDYRDVDPDRVAFYFERDIVRAAENRRASRVGTAFGL